MKISLLIREGVAQIILDPDENDPAEKAILALLLGRPYDVAVIQANVWGETRGGYIRRIDESPRRESTVLVLTPTPKSSETDKQPGEPS